MIKEELPSIEQFSDEMTIPCKAAKNSNNEINQIEYENSVVKPNIVHESQDRSDYLNYLSFKNQQLKFELEQKELKNKCIEEKDSNKPSTATVHSGENFDVTLENETNGFTNFSLATIEPKQSDYFDPDSKIEDQKAETLMFWKCQYCKRNKRSNRTRIEDHLKKCKHSHDLFERSFEKLKLKHSKKVSQDDTWVKILKKPTNNKSIDFELEEEFFVNDSIEIEDMNMETIFKECELSSKVENQIIVPSSKLAPKNELDSNSFSFVEDMLKFLADQTCLICDVESDSMDEAINHVERYHFNLIVEASIKNEMVQTNDNDNV